MEINKTNITNEMGSSYNKSKTQGLKPKGGLKPRPSFLFKEARQI